MVTQNEVVKILSEKIEGMKKRIQELEKICKNLCTERMEGSELSLQCNNYSTNTHHSSPLLSTDNDEGDEPPHAEETERTTTTACENEILIGQSST